MKTYEYHALLTLCALAPVFIGCILFLCLRQYILLQKYYRLKTHLDLIEKDLQDLAIVNRLIIKNAKASHLRVVKTDTDN